MRPTHIPRRPKKKPLRGEKVGFAEKKLRLWLAGLPCVATLGGGWIHPLVGAQYFESTENIRVFGGFLRAKGVFLEKNDGDRGVLPVFGKTLFVWKLFELGASEGLLEAVWAFLRRLRFEVCFSRVFTGFWCRFS